MAYKRDSSGLTVVILIVVALGAAALLLHLHRLTEWSHGASRAGAIARYGFEQNRIGP
jgi:hypothetical protein